jgi:hypothetical protein
MRGGPLHGSSEYSRYTELEVKHTLLQKEHMRMIAELNHTVRRMEQCEGSAERLDHRVSRTEQRMGEMEKDLHSVMDNDMIVLSTR